MNKSSIGQAQTWELAYFGAKNDIESVPAHCVNVVRKKVERMTSSTFFNL